MCTAPLAIAILVAGSAFAASNPAETVPFDHWAYDAVRELVSRGVLPPTALPPFPDVPRDHWAYDAVERLRLAGILVGYPDGSFNGGTSPKVGTVPFEHWADRAFEELIDRGIIIDYPRPGGRVSEAEFRAVIDRLLASPALPPQPTEQPAGPRGPAAPPR